MKAMRILAAGMLVLVATTAQAQGGQGGAMGPGGGQGGMQRQNEMLFKDITLTDAQKAKIDSIQTAGRAQMRELMQAGGGMQDPAAREKMMDARKKQNDAIRAVLTPEQQTQFDKNLAAMPQRGPGGGGPPGGGQRPPR